MGISPYYRGSSCNFWALYDGSPSYIGATIHMLSKGLDSGNILFHCVPKLFKNDSLFDFMMRSVAVAHKGLVEAITYGEIFSMLKVNQDKTLEIRYTKNADFTDSVASEFLNKNIDIHSNDFKYPNLLNPLFL